MHHKLAQVSDALRSAPPSLVPALSTCPTCGTVRQIAGPELGRCVECGEGMVVLDGDTAFARAARARYALT